MAFMVGGIMMLAKEVFNPLRCATIADCLAWATEARAVTAADKVDPGAAADIIGQLGRPDCPLLMALHPDGRLREGADPTDPANWNVIGYEILARSIGGGDAFPFPFYAKLSRPERIAWTLECARLSAFLRARGIVAKFNVQACDFAELTQHMAALGLRWSHVHYELAEFGQDADGCIGLPPTKAAPLDNTVFDFYKDAALDDCGEGEPTSARGYATVLALVQEQMERLGRGELQGKAFHTIKIDSVPAFAAFNHRHPNPSAPPPTPESCTAAAAALSAFVAGVWQLDPDMQIIVEATATTKEELARVPELDPSHPRVSFQGCHLRAQAILVAYPSNGAGTEHAENVKWYRACGECLMA